MFVVFTVGCTTIQPGRDPEFLKGTVVVEKLSGKVGVIQDGHYDAIRGNWVYSVRFRPSSNYAFNFPSSGYRTYNRNNQGSVWMNSFELEKVTKSNSLQNWQNSNPNRYLK